MMTRRTLILLTMPPLAGYQGHGAGFAMYMVGDPVVKLTIEGGKAAYVDVHQYVYPEDAAP